MEERKDPLASLKETISALEFKQAEDSKLLKEHLIAVYEKLKPINVIKNVFDEIAVAVEGRKGLINSLIGVITGYFTQRIIIGPKPGLIKKLMGVLLNYGVVAMISKYADTIKMLGLQLINQLFDQKGIEDSKIVQENKESIL